MNTHQIFNQKTVLVFLIILVSQLNSAIGQVSGIVRDSVNKQPLPGVSILDVKTKKGVATAQDGSFTFVFKGEKATLEFMYIGYERKVMTVKQGQRVEVMLNQARQTLHEVTVTGYGIQRKSDLTGSVSNIAGSPTPYVSPQRRYAEEPQYNTESYNAINENRFLTASQNPLSTFSIDVDAASYSNIRRYISNGSLPPKDAVRIEEMINYFDYDYPQPKNSDPVTISTEIAIAPWNPQHHLVKIGLQAKTIPTGNLPASNLVFLIDVSGSMNGPDRLPLVQSSMRLLVDQLREEDKVAIVVYAGAAGLVLPATAGNMKQKIKDAITSLQAGGSTAGGEGIALAYKIAKENFIENGNNRIILATDGDFNIGPSSDAEMQRLIEEKRKSGIYLTVLGYGMGNYKDSKMETLADKGNGNYAYIDNISEAKKTLVNEFGGTLFTVAKDVKLQVEFNPANVAAYRLIGYENRLLNKEDFNNDKKDAAELGSGHTVTALYEIIPAGVKSKFIEDVDDLKYQKNKSKAISANNELFTVKMRYKLPHRDDSFLITEAVKNEFTKWDNATENFRFASAVATYGMLLRGSEFTQNITYDQVVNWAKGASLKDKEGYRADFIRMAEASKLLAKDVSVTLKDKMIMPGPGR